MSLDVAVVIKALLVFIFTFIASVSPAVLLEFIIWGRFDSALIAGRFLKNDTTTTADIKRYDGSFNLAWMGNGNQN